MSLLLERQLIILGEQDGRHESPNVWNSFFSLGTANDDTKQPLGTRSNSIERCCTIIRCNYPAICITVGNLRFVLVSF